MDGERRVKEVWKAREAGRNGGERRRIAWKRSAPKKRDYLETDKGTGKQEGDCRFFR